MTKMQFEFVAYPGGGDKPETTHARYASDAAARSAAGRMAKKIDGPVDLVIAEMTDVIERVKGLAHSGLPSHLKPVMVCWLAGAAQKCLADLTNYLETPAPPSVETEEGKAV